MKLIVGLGNPGSQYARTRHNVGFMVVERLAARHGIGIGEKKSKGLTGKGLIVGQKVQLLLPQTFMNLSGEAVKPLFAYLDIGLEDVIVVHDDIDLDPGRLQIKTGGGHGGHNGLRSIIAHLGDPGFIRVRMGVGRPAHGGDVSGHVLSAFSGEERDILEALIERAADAVEAILAEGALKTMNRFN